MWSEVIAGKSEAFLAARQAILGGVDPAQVAEFDLSVATNIIQWVADPRFLNFPEVYAHWGQYQLLRDLCQIRCPICNPVDPHSEGPGRCWGKSRTELEDEVLFEWQVGQRDYVCPKCRGTRNEFLTDGLLIDYSILLACVGGRGGKSASIGIFATYLEHRLACMAGWQRDALARLLGQAPMTTFDVAFLAVSATQAERTIWDYYTGFRGDSQWFRRYVTKIKELARSQPSTGQRPWEYKELTKSVENGLIGISFQSLHSNSASLAGATRIAAFVDELARFDTTESKRSADEVWRVMTLSLKTVRRAAEVRRLPKILFGAKFATSTPISMDDKMMTLLGKSGELANVLALKMATWDFNPQLPKEAFAEEYAEDPIQAERDFGANPPLTVTPLIEDVPRFAKSIEPKLLPSVEFKTVYPEDAFGRQYVGVEFVDSIISPEVPRFICFDAGETRDSFAGAMGYPVWVEVEPDPGSRDKRRRILLTVYDWVLRILPQEKPKRTVWFESVVEIVKQLKENFKISRVTFDRWNSSSLIQSIRATGVPADQESITAADFVSFKAESYMGRIKLLPPEPEDRMSFDDHGALKLGTTPDKLSPQGVAIYELVKLSRSPDLKRVFNPNKGKRRGYDSDDVAQVVVGVHKQIQLAMSDDPTKMGRKDRLRREQAGAEQWGGGAAVPAMRHWTVVPSPAAGAFAPMGIQAGGGIPGYGAGDTWIGPDGQPSRSHNFGATNGIVKVKRW